MTDPGFNNLLKWGIANSSAANPEADSDAATTPQPTRSSGLDQAALAQLLGGPSDADRMREAMVAIQHPEIDLDNKLIAFDNFEQMIENLDNANNMEPLGLWPPLVEQLENEESELQRMAAWCVGTAVQNNVRSQDKVGDSVRGKPWRLLLTKFIVFGCWRCPKTSQVSLRHQSASCDSQKGCFCVVVTST